MTSAPIVINAIVRAREGKGNECEEIFAEMAASRAGEPGNIAWVVTRSVPDRDEFHLLEIYRDADALGEHLRLTREDPFRRRLAPLVTGFPETTMSSYVVGSWKQGQLPAVTDDGLVPSGTTSA